MERPELANIPFAVVNDNNIHSVNTLARKHGIVRYMPGFIAKQLCPQLEILMNTAESYDKYKNTLIEFKRILNFYDPEFEMIGHE